MADLPDRSGHHDASVVPAEERLRSCSSPTGCWALVDEGQLIAQRGLCRVAGVIAVVHVSDTVQTHWFLELRLAWERPDVLSCCVKCRLRRVAPVKDEIFIESTTHKLRSCAVLHRVVVKGVIAVHGLVQTNLICATQRAVRGISQPLAVTWCTVGWVMF